MTAFYNDTDPHCIGWLRNLVAAGLIRSGRVDARCILDVQPGDLAGFERVHLFAGIGLWDHALNLAGWTGPVWTGSCPCQPFSVAGRQRAHLDKRHLWPAFYRLIAECRPPVVFGEQIAGKLGGTWVAAVRHDMEGLGYRVGIAGLPACGVGAPHIRSRIYWVAISPSERPEPGDRCGDSGGRFFVEGAAARGNGCDDGAAGGLADARCIGAWGEGSGPAPGTPGGTESEAQQRQRLRPDAEPGSAAPGGLADAARSGWREERADGSGRDERSGAPEAEQRPRRDDAVGGVGDAVAGGLPDAAASLPEGAGRQPSGRAARGPGGTCNPWSELEWLWCRDGRWRPAQSGIFPLAHRMPGDVAKLRAYGNAIVAPLAVAFIRAVMGA